MNDLRERLLRRAHPMSLSGGALFNPDGPAAVDELDRLTAENSRIRAALATSSGACVYCSLTAEEWAKCSAGFPGCARADDAMGCPELGARLELEQLKTDLAEAEKRVWNAAIEAADAALLTRSCTCFEAIRALKKDKP